MGGSLRGGRRISMEMGMDKRLLAGAMLACLSIQAVCAAEPSLCMRVAEKAREAPAETWARSDPIAKWVRWSDRDHPSPEVLAFAQVPHWLELLAPPSNHQVRADRLADTPVHLVEYVAGTAICKRFILIEAKLGQAARQLASPIGLEDDTELCMTRSARFATVLGQPALVVGGAPSMTSADLSYRISAWTDGAWGRVCGLNLRRRTSMQAAQRFCAPGSELCNVAQPVAQRLAQAYEAARAANKPLDEKAFSDGQTPDAAAAAAAVAALNPPLTTPGSIGNVNPPSPLFGADETRLDPMLTTFSDPRRLPVFIDGRWWLAIVGRSGVGWREGGAVLVSLFAPPGRPGDGVASYQFRFQPVGLREATAADERH